MAGLGFGSARHTYLIDSQTPGPYFFLGEIYLDFGKLTPPTKNPVHPPRHLRALGSRLGMPPGPNGANCSRPLSFSMPRRALHFLTSRFDAGRQHSGWEISEAPRPIAFTVAMIEL